MASSKKIGFYWGEEKITVVDFEKNSPVQVLSSPLGSRSPAPSPFSSNLTEEIQITVILKKLLQDNQISGGIICVALPMKEIILRTFSIPHVNPKDAQSAVKFEVKRYIPFDIQDLSYVFHTIPFSEGANKRLQVVFFAARKEVLAQYERIFKQINTSVFYCEPYIVSLTKALLYRKEVAPAEHFAFLIIDKNSGRISFIDKGIPQFIREFAVSTLAPSEEANGAEGALNLKIVNEVLNSFDFYSRQFNAEKIDQLLIASDTVQKDLVEKLEAELKLKITRYSPVVLTGAMGQNSDMEAIYAMGACIAPPMESLSKFNFMEDKTPKPALFLVIMAAFKPYMDVVVTFFLCLVCLAVVNGLFQMRLKLAGNQYDRLIAQEGDFISQPQESIQAEVQQNIDKLAQYKNIKTRSDMAMLILRLASHIHQGTLLRSLNIKSTQEESGIRMSIDIQGMVVTGGFTEQIAAVNQIFGDFKNDKELSQLFHNLSLASLYRAVYNDRQVTGFVIHFS